MAKPNNPHAIPAPSCLSKDQASKLNTGARKASQGAVENLLYKLEVDKDDWLEVLVWLAREQGDDIDQHWQIVTALGALELPVPVDDAVWLLERLGPQLAFRARDSVLYGAALLLPHWTPALDSIVMHSFAGAVDRLRAAKVDDAYRIGVAYARAQLADTLSDEERADVRRALATTYVMTRGPVRAFVPGEDGELLEYDDINFTNDDVDEDWAAVIRPFGSSEQWLRAICEAAVELASRVAELGQQDPLVDRVLRHQEHASALELATVIAFGEVAESACEGDRGEVAERVLGDLDTATKLTIRKALRELARRTERTLVREVSEVLLRASTDPVEEIEALAARSSAMRDVRIYLPKRGETSQNSVAELTAGIYTEGTPQVDDVIMDHLLTLDLAEIPELQERFGSEAVAFFLSGLGDNQASKLGSGEVGVMKLTLEQAGDINEGVPFHLVPVDVPAAAFDEEPPAELAELAAKIRALPMRVLGPPQFVGGEGRTEGFVLQLSEDAIDAYFGGGVMYLYEDDGYWQC